jgi:hypothetical protein
MRMALLAQNNSEKWHCGSKLLPLITQKKADNHSCSHAKCKQIFLSRSMPLVHELTATSRCRRRFEFLRFKIKHLKLKLLFLIE